MSFWDLLGWLWVHWGNRATIPALLSFAIQAIFRTSLQNAYQAFLGSVPQFQFISRNMSVSFCIVALLTALLVAGLVLLGDRLGQMTRPRLYLNRESLAGHFGGRSVLSQAQTAHCVWLVGRKVAESGEDWEKIKKLILPDPSSLSLKHFEKSLPDGVGLANHIQMTTDAAKKHHVEVRWHPEFFGASWWIGNRDRPHAFIHFEAVPPHSSRDYRVSWRVFRWQNQDVYDRHCTIFDQMWDESKEPN